MPADRIPRGSATIPSAARAGSAGAVATLTPTASQPINQDISIIVCTSGCIAPQTTHNLATGWSGFPARAGVGWRRPEFLTLHCISAFPPGSWPPGHPACHHEYLREQRLVARNRSRPETGYDRRGGMPGRGREQAPGFRDGQRIILASRGRFLVGADRRRCRTLSAVREQGGGKPRKSPGQPYQPKRQTPE
jgi:hypothetical protein